MTPMKVSDAFRLAVNVLSENGIENPSFEADCLFESIYGTDRVKRINCPDIDVDYGKAEQLLDKRISGIPLQYILGKWDFYGFEYSVGEGVLIPRPETEILVEKCLDLLKNKKSPVIFDLCSGTGCIGLTLARLIPDSEVYLFEKSDKAFKYLEKNAQGIDNAHLINEDIFVSDCQKYSKPDLIVSNPPYINTVDLPSLQKEVRFEPEMALDGGEDGLDFYRLISQKWLEYLKTGGSVAVECGENQSENIQKEFSLICKNTYSVKDYNGTERIVIGEK
jgi:release factor glutamine methyltransferase